MSNIREIKKNFNKNVLKTINIKQENDIKTQLIKYYYDDLINFGAKTAQENYQFYIQPFIDFPFYKKDLVGIKFSEVQSVVNEPYITATITQGMNDVYNSMI